MKLTDEQIAIINSKGDIKINAVAGSGKTTTIIEYAKARPSHSKILYIVYNKSVKIEATKKFIDLSLNNVKVETSHSLAYKQIVFKNNYKVKQNAYTTNEIVAALNITGNNEKHTEFVIANHINKFITYFCNSNKQKVQDLNYLDTITDEEAKKFVSYFYDYILLQTRIFLSKMNSGEIEITHDFYLKKFQLSNPILNYDYILIDEGQDTSAVILEIFLKQKATKIIVGDTNQQIYSWRYAINSLEKIDFKTFDLSASFRFSQGIANLALNVLDYKNHLGNTKSFKIIGKGTSKSTTTKATLARTNLGLLLKAIEYISENKNAKKIYFEGNINSYTYADEGASLYDVLYLSENKKHLIKDSLIKAMKDIEELKLYIKKTEDVQLGMMVEIVEEYGDEIPQILKNLKAKHVDDADKQNAEMIFSTVHRSKGMEYDSVQLVNDFITEDKLIKLVENKDENPINITKVNEEINLLYVAITRTKNCINIPENLLPKNNFITSQINVLKTSNTSKESKLTTKIKPSKNYTYHEVRQIYNDSYEPWTSRLDLELKVLYKNGVNTKDLAKHFNRTKGAIESRLHKLKLD